MHPAGLKAFEARLEHKTGIYSYEQAAAQQRAQKFPAALARFHDQMSRHRLRREIIATVLDNDIVNLCGPTFVPRLKAGTGCDIAAAVIAFEAARQSLIAHES